MLNRKVSESFALIGGAICSKARRISEKLRRASSHFTVMVQHESVDRLGKTCPSESDVVIG